MNRNYLRSRSREQRLVNEYRSRGWYATRTPGSKSPVDVIAMRPAPCGIASHYEVELIQIKVSEGLKSKNEHFFVAELPFPANVKLARFPVKSKKYHAKYTVHKTKKGNRIPHTKRSGTKRVGATGSSSSNPSVRISGKSQ